MALLLGLLAFAGGAAIGAVFSLAVVGQYVAYSIPISARFLGGQPFKPGRFNLGIFVRVFLFINLPSFIYNRLPESPCCHYRCGMDVIHVDRFPIPNSAQPPGIQHELYHRGPWWCACSIRRVLLLPKIWGSILVQRSCCQYRSIGRQKRRRRKHRQAASYDLNISNIHQREMDG